MPPRTHTLGEARRFLQYLRAEAGRELRLARHNAGATQQQVADRIGWSKSKVSRIERGVTPRVALEDLVLASAVVGLRPSLRWFPSGRALRDQGQVELLATLTRRMHPSWTHRHEAPMPRPGDLRAADLLSAIPGCRLVVEAYRRFVDHQAQTRSAREKQRDLGADRLLIVVEATRTNRRAIAAAGPELRHSFPTSPRRMLAALAAGLDPGGDGILLLPRTTMPVPSTHRAAHPAVAADATNGQPRPRHHPPVAADATRVT